MIIVAAVVLALCVALLVILYRNSMQRQVEAENTVSDANSSPITVQCTYGHTLQISGKALLVTKGRKEEVIPISNIQSFSVKVPRFLSLGTITFKTAQAASGSVHLGFGFSTATGVERNFYFSKDQEESATMLRDFVIGGGNTSSTELQGENHGAVPSAADEIRKYKELLDMGAITQEEFDKKKAQLLNL